MKRDPSFAEFVAMIAAAMSMTALGIDAMLPALPEIGRALAVADANRLQWIVAVFVIGNGIGQVAFGPLADWLGRRPVLLAGLLLYIAFSAMAAFTASLPALLALRAAQGAAAAAGNVVTRSMVRDRYEGAPMARVLSIAFIVFLTVPILAPSLGQAILLVLPWQGIFGFLALAGTSVAAWIWLRCPETIRPEFRRAPDFTHLLEAGRRTVTEPNSIYYSLAITALMGSLLAYVGTVPQIFAEIYHLPRLMGPIFALCAGTMGVASYFNVRLIERIGMRRISHLSLGGFITVAAIHAALAFRGPESLAAFTVLQALTMACFGLAVSNFSAVAMQEMGAIAGSAASLQGVLNTGGGALVGAFIGQQWNGSVFFLPAGALCCGVAALGFVLLAERPRPGDTP